MADPARFSRDPSTPTRQLAAALAVADQELRVALVHARLAAGMSQKDVADALGISQAAVSQFERYDNDPHLSTVRRYALAVGASVAHQVTDQHGRASACGQWRLPWTSATPGALTFTVSAGHLAESVHVAAPDTARASLALAA